MADPGPRAAHASYLTTPSEVDVTISLCTFHMGKLRHGKASVDFLSQYHSSPVAEQSLNQGL